jgi:hypothetical protein
MAHSLQALMAELFRGLEPELRELAVAGGKMDHFYTLEMLVQCERIMAEQNSRNNPKSAASSARSPSAAAAAPSVPVSGSGSYLSSIVTSVSTHLKLSFNHFVDAEIEWIMSQKPSPKRCGVLQPFLRFPAMVDRMENVVAAVGAAGGGGGGVGSNSAAATSTPRGSSASASVNPASSVSGSSYPRSQAADTSYQKLSSALFRWLEGVARSDDKYTDVVVMENAHFFHTLFSTPHLHVPSLEQAVARTGVLYDTHCRRYVEWNIAYEMPLIVKFWDRLEDQLKSILPEDIPFAAELSKHDLRALLKGPLAPKMVSNDD